jgi:hypothetical protein
MPKSAKKRKDKAADFAKAKLKLGKGKQLASNAIDTSFKAKCAYALLCSEFVATHEHLAFKKPLRCPRRVSLRNERRLVRPREES